MKLSKTKLKRIILEVLSEANGGVTDQRAASAAAIKKQQRAKESQQEVGKLVARERQVVTALSGIQKALASQPGNQASQKVVMLVQRLIDELKKGPEGTITTEEGDG